MNQVCAHPTCETPAAPAVWHVRTEAVGHYRTTALDIETERRGRLAEIWPENGEDAPAYRARIIERIGHA